MSARLAFVEARARLADKQAAKLKAKDEAEEKSTVLKVLGIKEARPYILVPAIEAGPSRMASQAQEQDRVAAPTRDAGTTMGTLVKPEVDFIPETVQETGGAFRSGWQIGGSVRVDDEDGAPLRMLSKTTTK